MKTWYQTREAGNLQHRSQVIPEGKKILLTEEQAKLHNKQGEKVAKCDSPTEEKEAGVLAEYQEWKSDRSTKTTTVKTKEEVKSKK